MNKHKATTKLIPMVCPICGTSYQSPKKLPAPTCGNPNCIRTARARGLPFVVPTRVPELTTRPAKKRTPGKTKK